MATTFSSHYLPSVDPALYHHAQQPSYYDSSAFYPHFYHQQHQQNQQQQEAQQQHLQPPPASNPVAGADDLSNDPILALNLRVLRRHLPSTLRILYQAQYAVIYTFSPQSTGWEKSGKEGTLFIVQESARPGAQNSAALVVLNRRGMDNFVMRDWDPQVQSEGGHIILRGRVEGEAVAGGGGAGAGGEDGVEGEDLTVWGVWIWEEEDLQSTRGKREGVEACLVACAAGDVISTAAEEREPETTVDPSGDGAVFEEHGNLEGESWERIHQQQQQQQQHWTHQQPERQPQNFHPQQQAQQPHFQDHQNPQQQQQHHHHHPPPPPPQYQQQPYPHPQSYPPQHHHHHHHHHQHGGSSYQSPYQPTPSLSHPHPPPQPQAPPPAAEIRPSSPNLMALLTGTSTNKASIPQQQATTSQPGGNVSANVNANVNGGGGRDILGDLFRNVAAAEGK